MTFNIVFGDLNEVNRKLDLLTNLVRQVIAKEIQMSAELDALQAQVAANTTVVGSALTLIQGLRDQLIAAGTDPAKLKALTDSLAASDDALAAAIAANTPTTP